MSLWGEAFELPKQDSKNVIKKSKPKNATLSSNSLQAKLNLIKTEVYDKLGLYESMTEVITDYDRLIEYMRKSIENGIIAIDTETNNSLNSLDCDIMGLCIYTPNEKSAYVPVNHVDYIMKTKLKNQLTESQLRDALSLLGDTKIIGHNWKFDKQVINTICGIDLDAYWDTMLGAKMLNENEQANLKWQYADKIDGTVGKYNIESLFNGVQYAWVDYMTFALYSATDAYMTYKLYEYQQKEFTKPDNAKIYDLFINVEMPILKVSSDMETIGVEIDQEYAKRLQTKYHIEKEQIDGEIMDELDRLKPQIDKWRRTKSAHERVGKKTKSEQLADPPDMNSPTQLAILLYDVLGSPVIDKKNPRGTGADIIDKMDFPICEIMMKQKKVEKLINAFVDVIPTKVGKDGRLHGHFNQLGTGTGRFSATEPNLQQIPSKSKDIRRMFKARDGYMLVGSDYSQQEPRLLSAYSKEPKLIEAYKEGRDLYATLGTSVFDNTYWENMEHHEDGSPNPEGKKRRKLCKALYLGITYGMGANKLAERMGVPVEDAKNFLANFKKGYTVLTKWMDDVQNKAEQLGYAEDLWGRRRRLPDAMLPRVELSRESSITFNPLLYTSGMKEEHSDIEKKLLNELLTAKGWKAQRDAEKKATDAGFKVTWWDNKKSKAMRQSVNACIQGSAATCTKLAMIKIANDELMKQYGFRLLIAVHDELIGECKEEYAEECAERLEFLMKDVVEFTGVPFKCDAVISKGWYDDEMASYVQDALKKGTSKEEIMREHSEFTEEDFNYLSTMTL